MAIFRTIGEPITKDTPVDNITLRDLLFRPLATTPADVERLSGVRERASAAISDAEERRTQAERAAESARQQRLRPGRAPRGRAPVVPGRQFDLPAPAGYAMDPLDMDAMDPLDYDLDGDMGYAPEDDLRVVEEGTETGAPIGVLFSTARPAKASRRAGGGAGGARAPVLSTEAEAALCRALAVVGPDARILAQVVNSLHSEDPAVPAHVVGASQVPPLLAVQPAPGAARPLPLPPAPAPAKVSEREIYLYIRKWRLRGGAVAEALETFTRGEGADRAAVFAEVAAVCAEPPAPESSEEADDHDLDNLEEVDAYVFPDELDL